MGMLMSLDATVYIRSTTREAVREDRVVELLGLSEPDGRGWRDCVGPTGLGFAVNLSSHPEDVLGPAVGEVGAPLDGPLYLRPYEVYGHVTVTEPGFCDRAEALAGFCDEALSRLRSGLPSVEYLAVLDRSYRYDAFFEGGSPDQAEIWVAGTGEPVGDENWVRSLVRDAGTEAPLAVKMLRDTRAQLDGYVPEDFFSVAEGVAAISLRSSGAETSDAYRKLVSALRLRESEFELALVEDRRIKHYRCIAGD
ncbi:hypothetical protein ACGFX4_40655 [Kitasatospora sp. NPDC048365]|uniref:hypothetical protein n=1 Tax=Kitasatospora sp. NPDC048365 TaxID=3364050 RepID=UPI003712C5CB